MPSPQRPGGSITGLLNDTDVPINDDLVRKTIVHSYQSRNQALREAEASPFLVPPLESSRGFSGFLPRLNSPLPRPDVLPPRGGQYPGDGQYARNYVPLGGTPVSALRTTLHTERIHPNSSSMSVRSPSGYGSPSQYDQARHNPGPYERDERHNKRAYQRDSPPNTHFFEGFRAPYQPRSEYDPVSHRPSSPLPTHPKSSYRHAQPEEHGASATTPVPVIANDVDDAGDTGDKEQRGDSDSSGERPSKRRMTSQSAASMSAKLPKPIKPLPKDPGNPKAKRYPCRYRDLFDCQAMFSTSGHASRHAKTHTKEKNVHCLHPDCDRTFTRGDNMKQHLRTHTRHIKQASGARRVSSKKKQQRKGREEAESHDGDEQTHDADDDANEVSDSAQTDVQHDNRDIQKTCGTNRNPEPIAGVATTAYYDRQHSPSRRPDSTTAEAARNYSDQYDPGRRRETTAAEATYDHNNPGRRRETTATEAVHHYNDRYDLDQQYETARTYDQYDSGRRRETTAAETTYNHNDFSRRWDNTTSKTARTYDQYDSGRRRETTAAEATYNHNDFSRRWDNTTSKTTRTYDQYDSGRRRETTAAEATYDHNDPSGPSRRWDNTTGKATRNYNNLSRQQEAPRGTAYHHYNDSSRQQETATAEAAYSRNLNNYPNRQPEAPRETASRYNNSHPGVSLPSLMADYPRDHPTEAGPSWLNTPRSGCVAWDETTGEPRPSTAVPSPYHTPRPTPVPPSSDSIHKASMATCLLELARSVWDTNV